MGRRARFVKLSATALVGVGWLSPWRAPAEPVAVPAAVDEMPRPASGPTVLATAIAPAPEPAPEQARPVRQARPTRAATRPRPTDVWLALARCESGGDPAAVSADGRYFGAFQFNAASWQLVGMTGSPVDHPYAVQLAAARRLHTLQGWGAWPACARRLGLLS